MPDLPFDPRLAWYGKNLDDVDRELLRLCSICHVRLLEPGVIERVLHDDPSVCGTRNDAAFGKLRSLLMMHYQIRDKAVAAIGEAKTQALIDHIVKRLRERVGPHAMS